MQTETKQIATTDPNELQHLEDKMASGYHFKIRPLPQYGQVL